ncbi:MAG: trigger factor [Erysipelotrichaceae bacterium]|nr:trigger factor [Erysipelotrichaceae bacterium]
MSEYKKVENAKAELTCTLEGEAWEKAKEAAFRKLAAKVEIKGFRKGQAPKHLAEKYISHNEVLLDAAEALAQGALEAAIKEHDVTLIDRPELKVDSIDDEKCVMTFVCPTVPDVKLGDYKSLEYKVDEVKVEDQEIDDQIAGLLDRKADLELKEDGAVEDGDTAVIDYEGFLGDEPFEGGKDENHDLVIGSHSFIPGFEEQLIGMKSEETKDIMVRFPKEYHAADLADKEARFTVTVHEIKKKVLPELNDEFVKELKYDNVNTVEELRNYTKENLERRKKDDAQRNADNALMDKLVEMTEVEIPDAMVKSELDSMIQNYEANMMQQGISLAQFLKITNQTVDQLRDSMKDDAKKRIKINLALSEIAKSENISVNEEDLNKEYERMAEMYSMSVDEIKTYVPEETLKDDLKLQKALDLLKK